MEHPSNSKQCKKSQKNVDTNQATGASGSVHSSNANGTNSGKSYGLLNHTN